jgi:hypothetical protein
MSSFSERNAMQGSEEMVGELVKDLQFSICELLLLEVGSRGTGIFREPRVSGKSTVESRYQARISE